MDAVKFIEEHRRMCRTYYGCDGCLARNNDGSCKFSTTVGDGANEQIALLEEWSAAHPRKTRQSVFLKQYPEAKIEKDGYLGVCPYLVSASHRGRNGLCAVYDKDCIECRHEFWPQEVE